jgi:hypothetical protein
VNPVKDSSNIANESVSDGPTYQELHGLRRATVKSSASGSWHIPMSEAVQRVGENVADLVKWNLGIDTQYSWKS